MLRAALVSTDDPWSERLYADLRAMNVATWTRVTLPEEYDSIAGLDYVFLFRWPHIVPKRVQDFSKCITFHTSLLPEGRGGSPLQHQIAAGVISSRVNALAVADPVDTGDVYLTAPITLQGSANDIWLALASVTSKMIAEIMTMCPVPVKQDTNLPALRRRRDNDMTSVLSQHDPIAVMRFIQMLDGVGYPGAFVDIGAYRITMTRAGIAHDGSVVCDARIRLNRCES